MLGSERLPQRLDMSAASWSTQHIAAVRCKSCLSRYELVVTQEIGRPHHFATLGFANYFSWRNTLGMGGRVVAIYEFEDPRYGPTSRMLTHRAPAPPPLADQIVWLDCLDIAGQRECLRTGLVGTEYRMSSRRAEIGYRREVP